MLFGSETFLELREDIMLAISSLSVACRYIVQLLSFKNNVYVTILYFFFVVSAIEAK